MGVPKRGAEPDEAFQSAAMLLSWLAGERRDAAAGDAGQAIERAVVATLAGNMRTRDLGGTASTGDFTTCLLEHLRG